MKHNEAIKEWDLTIEGKNSPFDINLADIWRYRDLLMMLIKRDFISFYKQTIFGPIWFFVQPIMTTIVFTFVFGNLAQLSTDGLPQPLFYLAGITAWNYFAESLTKTSTVFKDNQAMFGKVYFPRIIMPISIVASNIMKFGVQFGLFILVIIYYLLIGVHFTPNWFALLFPVLVLLMAFLGLGLGMIINSLTTKYRDLTFLVQFGVQLLMYSTTVIYPLSAAPEHYKFYIELNPMTAIIETFRYGFLGQGSFSIQSLGYSALVTLIILFIGILIFNKTEKSFVDTV